jgi:hypothetical protein
VQKGTPVTPTARALGTVTGDPTLKLILLCVAAAPGWPTAADIATTAEVPGWTAAAALDELTRRGQVTAHTGIDATRYGVPDDSWGYDRPDSGTPAEAPQGQSLAALETGEVSGYPMTGRQGQA